MVGPSTSQGRSYHWKRCCLNRLIGATLGALLLLPVFSVPAFAVHQSFGPPRDWTGGPYYGESMTLFADVTGDGKADAIVQNFNTITVRRSDGCRFGPNEDWTGGPYSGEMWTYFADVTGDGKVDAIALNSNTVTVRRSTGTRFGPAENWTGAGPVNGNWWTDFADVTGDGKADAIILNSDTVMVRRSTGTRFGPAENWTGAGPILGEWGTDFVDVTGDRKADAAILVDGDPHVMVRPVIASTSGNYFGTAVNWAVGGPISRGWAGTFFADVNGNRKVDAIIVNEDNILVREGSGSGFAPARRWTAGPYYGELGTFFADVTGDGAADAIVVNYDTVTVRRSMFNDYIHQKALERACYGN